MVGSVAAVMAVTVFTTFGDLSASFATPVAAVGLAPLALAPFVRLLVTEKENERARELRGELRERTRELERLQKLERDPVDQFVDINLTNLESYYALVGRHTDRSFQVSVLSGLIGFALLVIGLTLGFLVSDDSDKVVGYITAGSGVLIQFISAIFFFLYRRTVAELKTYHERLLRVQNTLIAFRYVKGIENESERSKMLGLMVGALVAKEAAEAAIEGLEGGPVPVASPPPTS